MKDWLRVRADLAQTPIVEGMAGGETPLFVERYLYQADERRVTGVSGLALVIQLGGARVLEGEEGHWRTDNLPSQSILVPPKCATHWHYKGVVDFAVFYFPERLNGIGSRLARVAAASKDPLQFNDALVAATAMQVVDELQKGHSADERFLSMLTAVMLEQTYRTLTTPTTGIRPRHIHAVRLQAVLNYVREHLADDISIQTLAKTARVSVAHFRRIFLDAMHIAPHRYVNTLRLEQARNLLATTDLPISHIAQNCGFSSQSHLTASFRKVHAVAPGEYRTHTAPNTSAGKNIEESRADAESGQKTTRRRRKPSRSGRTKR